MYEIKHFKTLKLYCILNYKTLSYTAAQKILFLQINQLLSYKSTYGLFYVHVIKHKPNTTLQPTMNFSEFVWSLHVHLIQWIWHLVINSKCLEHLSSLEQLML